MIQTATAGPQATRSCGNICRDSLSVFAEGSLVRTNQPPKWGKGESCEGGGAPGGEILSGHHRDADVRRPRSSQS